MQYPSININEIPDMDTIVGTAVNSVETAANVGSGELLIIIATYVFESAHVSTMIF